jgi:DNA-binding MarR family transcriptional regulator/N-acetylglutamate synthase-like GNAT family acetyltransferase
LTSGHSSDYDQASFFSDFSQETVRDTQIPAVRSFSRAGTLRVGSFTDRFLGRGRPLGEARLLFEIGRRGADVRELRLRLDLDSGYVSRLLRSLERQGLVEVVPSEADRRIRNARLTPDGEVELASLDRGGDEFAASLLEPLTEAQRSRIVEAMTEVERLLDLSFTRITVEDPTSRDAVWCLQQYCAELAARFDAGFEVGLSISADDHELRDPLGAFLVAHLDARPVGCGAIKTAAPGVGSIKRMWVSKAMRGIGLGRRLLAALEDEGRRLGLRVLRLETNRSLTEAQSLYRRNGYREVEAFNDEPYAAHWFEKTLEPSREASTPTGAERD